MIYIFEKTSWYLIKVCLDPLLSYSVIFGLSHYFHYFCTAFNQSKGFAPNLMAWKSNHFLILTTTFSSSSPFQRFLNWKRNKNLKFFFYLLTHYLSTYSSLFTPKTQLLYRYLSLESLFRYVFPACLFKIAKTWLFLVILKWRKIYLGCFYWKITFHCQEFSLIPLFSACHF